MIHPESTRTIDPPRAVSHPEDRQPPWHTRSRPEARPWRRRWPPGRVLIGLALLVAPAILSAAFLLSLGLWIARLPDTSLAALGATGLLAATAWIATSGAPRARRVAMRDRLRSRRFTLYDGLLSLHGSRAIDPPDPTQLWEFERRLALIGSTRVLACYVAYRDQADETRWLSLVAAMRHDLRPSWN